MSANNRLLLMYAAIILLVGFVMYMYLTPPADSLEPSSAPQHTGDAGDIDEVELGGDPAPVWPSSALPPGPQTPKVHDELILAESLSASVASQLHNTAQSEQFTPGEVTLPTRQAVRELVKRSHEGLVIESDAEGGGERVLLQGHFKSAPVAVVQSDGSIVVSEFHRRTEGSVHEHLHHEHSQQKRSGNQ